jgi:hypothetical protein
MNFALKWKHLDGSMVEFSETGWRSDDPEKAGWLTKMNDLSSAETGIAPGVRICLQQYGNLVEFRGVN